MSLRNSFQTIHATQCYDRKRTNILSQAQPSSVLHARPARSVWSTPPAQQDLMIQLQAGTCWHCFMWRANLTLPASLPTVTETQAWREAPNKTIHSKGACVWLLANSRCPGSFTIQIRDGRVGGIMVWLVLVSPALQGVWRDNKTIKVKSDIVLNTWGHMT